MIVHLVLFAFCSWHWRLSRLQRLIGSHVREAHGLIFGRSPLCVDRRLLVCGVDRGYPTALAGPGTVGADPPADGRPRAERGSGGTFTATTARADAVRLLEPTS